MIEESTSQREKGKRGHQPTGHLDEIEIISTEVDMESEVFQLDVNSNAIRNSNPSEFDSPVQSECYDDNWVHKLLCYTWPGRVANSTLLVTLTYITFFTRANAAKAPLADELDSRMFLIILATEASMHLVLLLLVYPLSRFSSSTKYYWTIGTIASIAITSIGLYDLKGKVLNELARFAVAIEFTRLTMKVASFLVECNKSCQTFHQTTWRKLLYFLFAPTLNYRTEYPKTPKIRLLSIIHYLWWTVVLSFLGTQVFFHVMLPLVRIDLATVNLPQLMRATFYIFIFLPITYVVAVLFAFWEIWNGFWGEMLHFSNRRVLADPKDFLIPRKFIRSLNVLVNDFLNDHIYKPVHTRYKSRLIALTVVFFTCLAHHETCLSFIFNQILLVHLLWPIFAAPGLLKRKPNVVIRCIRTFCFFTVLPSYLFLHIIEFFAWNSSSIDIENESKFRLIPLSFSYLARIVLYPNSTGRVF